MERFALKMLLGDKVKFMTLVVGLTFSVLLISQQSSIFCGLMRRFTTNIRNIHAPMWVMDPGIRYIDDVKPMLDTDLARVQSITGVDWAVPYFQRLTQAQLRNGLPENVYLIGIDGHTLYGAPQQVVAGNIQDLNTPDAVAVDKKNLHKLGDPKIGDMFEINDHRARVVAILDIGSGFQGLPYVYTTYDRAKIYAPNTRKMLSFILVLPKPNVTLPVLAQRIQKATGLAALTEDEFSLKTLQYFFKNTGIPINFGVTVLLGVLVGTAIAAQTFYTFTIENMRQFATMKAMGASRLMLTRMVLLQSLMVGSIGFGLGVGAASWFGFVMTGKSELSFFMPWQVPVIAFVMVVVVSLLSGILSLWKILRIDPAIVFRN